MSIEDVWAERMIEPEDGEERCETQPSGQGSIIALPELRAERVVHTRSSQGDQLILCQAALTASVAYERQTEKKIGR